MHKEYGKGPIKPKKLTDRLPEHIISNFLNIAGKDKISDDVLVLMYRASGNE
jgi:hypothetical protein